MSRKKSLSDKLAELANPTPKFIDPEDEFNDETNAQLEQYDEDFSQRTEVRKGIKSKPNLRQKNATILADTDKKYAGKKVSRKELAKQDDDDHEEDEFNQDESDESGSDDDTQIQKFLSMMKAQSSVSGTRSTQKKPVPSDSEEGSEDVSEEGSEEGSKEGSNEGSNEGYEEGSEEEDGYDLQGEEEESDLGEGDVEEYGEDDDEIGDEEDDDADVEDREKNKTAKRSVTSEIEKGKAIQSQLSLWDHLLECRIKLHKGIHLANQLPPGPVNLKRFVKAGDVPFSSAVKEAQIGVKTLLDSLIELQDLVLKTNPQTRAILKEKSDIKDDESDEEIPSDTEDEVEDEAENKDDQSPPTKKMKVAEYETEIQKRHERFRDFSHRALHLWNEKTRLASGRAGGKAANKSAGFGAFEQSILKQIEIILADKQRLINRTRIKRSVYRILGTEPKSRQTSDDKQVAEQQSEEEPAAAEKTKEDDEFDPEIYDDDDFYHQLLRELIERRTGDGGSDQVSIGRQWLEIQKLRSKAKRKVDPKASKGRRLRFQVHPKLVSLMAPHPETSWNDAAKNELFASLFTSA